MGFVLTGTSFWYVGISGPADVCVWEISVGVEREEGGGGEGGEMLTFSDIAIVAAASFGRVTGVIVKSVLLGHFFLTRLAC